MDYKIIIKKRKSRLKLLRKLYWLPDDIMVRLQYRIKLGFWPNLKNPRRYTEKIQLYKIWYKNPVLPHCVDKYDVREYVKSKGLDEILNNCHGIYESAEEIDWNVLPNQFVMKKTTGGGGLNVVIVNDKESHGIEKLKSIARSWTKPREHFQSSGREWAYDGIEKNRVIIEDLIVDDKNIDGSIDDYKFMCYDGKFRFLWIDKNRYSNHKRGFWDEHLNFLEGVSSDHDTFEVPPQLPQNIEEMIMVAERLSEDFPYARVDLYNIKGKIYFGEITFYPWSGYVKFNPDSFDFDLGKYFDVSSFIKN